MIKKIKDILSKSFRSLRSGMLLSIIFALVLGITVSVSVRYLFINWIENDYNSSESRKARYEGYVANLQAFVDKNRLSSDNTAEITNWVRSNRNIYLFIYKDNQLFFDSSVQPEIDKNENENENENSSSNSGSLGENGGKGEENSGGSQDAENENTDGVTGGSSGGSNADGGESVGEKEDAESNKNNSSEGNNGGLTVQYPTREEIIESAKNNGLLPLTLSDGTLFVSLADFTEYIYYDVANIASLAVGVLIIIIVLMLYFQKILFKISRLAKDVSAVYEVDMNTPVRTDKGNDELSVLTRNVEQMRSSMIESLENEKEAINANTELITSMSHDIRTPLTVLLGYLDIMKSSTDDKMMSEYIKASEATALRLKELSDDMFRYFLVFGSGELETDINDYDARTILAQLLTEHVLLLGERGYKVDMQLDDSIKVDTRVMTDAPKTMRIIDNLFSNIHKYADKEKTVSIRSYAKLDKLFINVKNYVNNSVNEAERNGVGLKTCKKICEAIGADFDYRSEYENGEKIFVAEMAMPIKN